MVGHRCQRRPKQGRRHQRLGSGLHGERKVGEEGKGSGLFGGGEASRNKPTNQQFEHFRNNIFWSDCTSEGQPPK